MALRPGDKVPDITLLSHTMEPVSFADFRGNPLVIFFFPLAFSSTCTEEVCTVGEDLDSYRDLNAQVVGISVDSPYVLGRFREECGAAFPFLSDFHREASKAFDVLRKEPLRSGLRGVSDRAAFVVDAGGGITYAWHDENPSLLPPFQEIKEALRKA